MGNALWDPHPTKTDLRARQLAVALGYPLEWRVVRTIEKMEISVEENDNDDDGIMDDTGNKPTTSSTVATTTHTDKAITAQVETATAPTSATLVAAAATTEAQSETVAPSSTKADTQVAAEAPETPSAVAPVAVAAEPATTSVAVTTASSTVTEPPVVATTTTAAEAAAPETALVAATAEASTPEAAAPTSAAETLAIAKAPEAVSGTNQPDTKTAITADNNEANEAKSVAKAPPTSEIESLLPAKTKPDPAKSLESLDETKSSEINDNRKKNKTQVVSVIVDRIYAGKPGTGCDMWVHHEAAMQAAQAWIIHGKKEEEDEENAASSNKGPTPFDHKGGHLLPRLPRFAKGDKVQVSYEDEWWDAKILRRREHAEAGFRYQVQYVADHSKQSGVEEDLIRPIKADTDALAAAASIGLVEGGWKAYVDGYHKWKIEAPDGTLYRSKKVALEAYAKEYKQPQEEEELVEEGDPPWRTTGHDYLGRHVRFVQHHQVSARRSVRVEQIGTVTGWISETDVDKAGEPGFVSEKTGAPAALFHVVFDDEPNHPYSSMLVQSQDLEEYELLECVLSEEEYRPPKKARKR